MNPSAVKEDVERPATEEGLDSLYTHLTALATRLTSMLDPLIADRSYRLKIYKKCFICSEVVDLLVHEGLAISREHAVALGVELQQHLQLWHHVVDSHHRFADKYLFFRLAPTGGTNASQAMEANQHYCADESYSLDALHVLAIQLLEGLDIKDRTYRLRKYKKCFVCSEAVDYMVAQGLATSRQGAVQLGIALQTKAQFWHHVVDHHLFMDKYLFFRLSRDEDKNISSSSDHDDSKSTSTFRASTSHVASAALLCDSPPRSDGRRLQLDHFSCHKEEKRILRNMLRTSSNNPQMAFIGGPSGSGKSYLIRAAFAGEMLCPDSFFAAAKFDQTACSTIAAQSASPPFAIVREWMCDLAGQVEMGVRRDIQAALTERLEESPKLFQAMHQLLPKEHVMHLVSPSTRLRSTQQEEERAALGSTIDVFMIKLAVQVFFRALAAASTVVLVADDIMWADDLTLDILEFLMMDEALSNLLLVTTYRDNEVGRDHRLQKWKQSLEENPLLSDSIETLHLVHLTLQSIRQILSLCLKREEEEVDELATLLLDRTDGNIFFLIQLLQELQDCNAICYEPSRFRWAFSMNDITKCSTLSDNVGQLVCSRIGHLPDDGREILKLASIFGSRVDSELLEITKSAVKHVVEDVGMCLESACEEKMLIRISSTQYKFAHDQIQSAACSMLPSGDENARIRLNIAKLLLVHPSLFENDTLLFACVDQVQQTSESVEDECDRVRFAEVCLAAGTRSAGMSAFLQASTYLGIGVKLLGSHKGFAAHYELAMRLHTLLCETTYSLGQHDFSKEVADIVLKYSKAWNVKVPALMILFECWLASADPVSCLEFGLELSETLGGEKIPRNPSRMDLVQERRRFRSALKAHSDEEILNLPSMVDKNMNRCLSVLCKLTDVSFHAKDMAVSEIIYIRIVLITLQHGLSEWAPAALANAAQHAIAQDRDLQKGTRLAKLAEETLYLCPSGAAHYFVAIVKSVTDTSRNNLNMCMTGYKLCMANGDLAAAAFSITIYCWSYFYSGLPFLPLLEDIGQFAHQMLEYRQTFAFLHALPLWQALLNLSGASEDPLDVQTGAAIERRNMVSKGDAKIGTEAPKSYGMQIALYFGELEKATELYHEVVEFKVSGRVVATSIYLARVFFFGLICIGNVKIGKHRYKAEAKKHISYIRELVESGGMNLVHKLQILEAEYNSLDTASDANDLLNSYQSALIASSKSGFVQDAALCANLAAEFCCSRPELHKSSEMYMMKAHDLYLTWGASAVAESIRSRHPKSFSSDSHVSVGARASSGLQSRTRFRNGYSSIHRSKTC